MCNEKIQSRYIFNVSSKYQVVTYLKYFLKKGDFVRNNYCVIYSFPSQPSHLFLSQIKSDGVCIDTEILVENDKFNYDNQSYSDLEVLLNFLDLKAITKAMYVAWYLNNHFHQHLSKSKKRFKLVEFAAEWRECGNHIEIPVDYMDKVPVDHPNRWEQTDYEYIGRLSKIFNIEITFDIRSYPVPDSVYYTSVLKYYSIGEADIDRLTEMALAPPTLKCLLFNQINKTPDFPNYNSQGKYKNLVDIIVLNLKETCDAKEWAQKSNVEKIQICLSFLPPEIVEDPRFLLMTYPELRMELVKDVERELKQRPGCGLM